MKDQICFGLRKITTGQFGTIDSVVIKDDSINVSYGITFGINEEKRVVGCITKFEFFSEGIPFMVIDITCEFEFDPESWESFIDKETNRITLPLSIASHMAVLTVGTTRGVLHSKTENTKYNKYFLPTINVTESLKSDITIDLVKAE